MNLPASSAEVFTIDFVPDDISIDASAHELGHTGPQHSNHQSLGVPAPLRGSAIRKWNSASPRPQQNYSSQNNDAKSGFVGRGQLGRQASKGLDQFIGDQTNAMVAWLWESLRNNQFHFWPLTIYGPSAVGKSKLTSRLALTALHQLKATASEVAKSSSGRVLSIAAKDFYRSFRRSLDINSVADWRANFETAAVFLLDDLQHLLDHADVQHELCEILDRRMMLGLPTILVSNISPLTMGLSATLSSRLSGGFCCGLSAPGPEALVTIIQRLFTMHHTEIDLEQAKGLVECGVSEIGLINQIVWRWKLEKGSQPFQLQAASSTLRQLIGAASENAVAPEKVLRATARQFECLLKDLRGSSRKSTLVRARGVAIWICRSRLQLSFKAIGKLLGNRDHTTIINGMEKTCALLDSDPSVALATDRILQKLGLAKRKVG